MSEGITLLLEDAEGNTQQATCGRFAVMLEGKQLWVQEIGGQLFIGTDVEEDENEYTNLVVRPMATNLVSLQIEIEPMEEGTDLAEDEECCGKCGCSHE